VPGGRYRPFVTGTIHKQLGALLHRSLAGFMLAGNLPITRMFSLSQFVDVYWWLNKATAWWLKNNVNWHPSSHVNCLVVQ